MSPTGRAAEPEPGPGPGSRRSGLFAGDGYLALDTRRLAADDPRLDNAAALLAGLCAPQPDSAPDQAEALRRRLAAPPLRELLEVVMLWAQRTAQSELEMDLGAGNMAEMDRHYESGELHGYFGLRRRVYQERYRKEGRKEGMERGIEQGEARGMAAERPLLQRQASRKYGAGADERLAPLLADVGDAEALATTGEWIIDCATLDELLARLDGLA